MIKNRKEVNCSLCGKPFEKTLSQIKRSKNHYCSVECRHQGLKVPEEQKQATKKNNFKKWKDKNKEKIQQYNFEYRQNNKEKVNSLYREWYQKNKKELLLKVSKRYQEDKEYRKRRNDYQNKWAKENPEKALLQRQRHKEKARITSRLRQVKKVAQKYNCEIGNGQEIREFYETALNIGNTECYYCKKECGKDIAEYKKDATVDHKIPLSRGGKHDRTNLVIACRYCNSMKCSKTDKEFFDFLEIIKQLDESESE